MKIYNETNNTPIINYRVKEYKSALVVKITDLKYR